MNAMPAWVQDTIAQFGQQLGVPALAIGSHGVAALELHNGGLLAIEPGRARAPEVLVVLGRPLGFDGGAALRKALAMAHHGAAATLPVQVAVRGEGPDALLLALARVPEREFNLQRLGQTVDFLLRWTEGALHG
jgi:type III secretion system chaperone SycN